MNVLIVHGYFLEGDSNNSYVYNLAREIKKKGHRAIILSQESKVIDYSLVDRIYEFSFGNKIKKMTYKTNITGVGECILIKPEIEGFLPVYKDQDIEGYRTKEFHKMNNREIQEYSNLIKGALENILEEIEISIVVTTHLFPEPLVVEFLRRKHPYIKHCCIVEGDCFYYSYLKNKDLKRFITPIFSKIDSLVFLDQNTIKDLTNEFEGCSELINSKASYIPPGVNSEIFKFIYNDIDKNRILGNLKYKLKNENEDTSFLNNLNWQERLNILTYGDLSLEKGIPLLILILPFIRASFPEVKLYIVGSGKNKKRYEELTRFLSENMRKEFYELLQIMSNEFGEENAKKNFYEISYLNFIDPTFAETYFNYAKGLIENIEFVNYLNQSKLADFISLMDLCTFPVVSGKGYPVSVYEPVASGIPIIIPNAPGMAEVEDEIRNIYQNEFNLEEYKKIEYDENFLDNLILDISLLLSYIKENEKKGEIIELKERISQKVIKKHLWFTVYENIIKTVYSRS